jgi:hypothetical protein
MSEIHFHKTTTLSPEQFVAGLTDFTGSRRSSPAGTVRRPDDRRRRPA